MWIVACSDCYAREGVFLFIFSPLGSAFSIYNVMRGGNDSQVGNLLQYLGTLYT